ncbi:hypothetical protein BKA62DRAFT_684263 [Auriculariales sp. MPI-PUGE-AT-0066]|nr:hypothetical protein BKA62DRAFT_684263 [Auriculariales sp. MPI-PUGE-AT-0066]
MSSNSGEKAAKALPTSAHWRTQLRQTYAQQRAIIQHQKYQQPAQAPSVNCLPLEAPAASRAVSNRIFCDVGSQTDAPVRCSIGVQFSSSQVDQSDQLRHTKYYPATPSIVPVSRQHSQPVKILREADSHAIRAPASSAFISHSSPEIHVAASANNTKAVASSGKYSLQPSLLTGSVSLLTKLNTDQPLLDSDSAAPTAQDEDMVISSGSSVASESISWPHNAPSKPVIDHQPKSSFDLTSNGDLAFSFSSSASASMVPSPCEPDGVRSPSRTRSPRPVSQERGRPRSLKLTRAERQSERDDASDRGSPSRRERSRSRSSSCFSYSRPIADKNSRLPASSDPWSPPPGRSAFPFDPWASPYEIYLSRRDETPRRRSRIRSRSRSPSRRVHRLPHRPLSPAFPDEPMSYRTPSWESWRQAESSSSAPLIVGHKATRRPRRKAKLRSGVRNSWQPSDG